MTDETNSGAASQVSPPRALQPVTRGGVATGQLRRTDGKFGGKMPRTLAEQRRAERPAPMPFDEAIAAPPPGYLSLADYPEPYEPVAYEQPDAVEGYREMVSEHDKHARLVGIFGILLAVGVIAYFGWQFFLRFA
jgi:hypothetical protein